MCDKRFHIRDPPLFWLDCSASLFSGLVTGEYQSSTAVANDPESPSRWRAGLCVFKDFRSDVHCTARFTAIGETFVFAIIVAPMRATEAPLGPDK